MITTQIHDDDCVRNYWVLYKFGGLWIKEALECWAPSAVDYLY